MRRFLRLIAFLLGIHVAGLLMLSLFRLAQFGALHSMMAKDGVAPVSTAFVKGVWFDNVIACYVMVVPLAVLLIAEWLTRDREHPLQFASASWPAHHASVRWGCYAMLATAISLLAGTQSQFIYFQF